MTLALELQRELSVERVLAQAERLPFVVLVTQLAQLLGSDTAVGDGGPYDQEPVRFRHDTSLGFHHADVARAQLMQQEGGRRWVELTTSFAGLTGTASPLPPSFIERFCRDDDEHNAQREFLDLFHHRLLGLFYRGRLKFDLPRSTRRDGQGRVLDWVLMLAGFAPEHAERLTGLTRGQLLSLAPLLVTYPANAERLAVALRHVLSDLLGGAQVQVAEMRGGFVVLEPGARARLGVDLALGQNTTLGRRAPAPASELAVLVAPLTPAACARLSPGGDRHRELSAVARLFCPDTIEVQVELTPTNSVSSRLGTPRARLGRDSWLRGRGRPAPVRFTLPPASTRKDGHAS